MRCDSVVACKPVSMQKGFDELTALTSQVLGADPYLGHLFRFRGKRGDYLKTLYWDGSGMCLFAKREKGQSVWPPLIADGIVLSTRIWRCSSKASTGDARWCRLR